jgi:hypothetical protein
METFQMIAPLAFGLGVLAGFVIVAVAAVIIMNCPEPEHTATPVQWGAVSVPPSYAPESNAPVEWPAALRNAPADTRLN